VARSECEVSAVLSCLDCATLENQSNEWCVKKLPTKQTYMYTIRLHYYILFGSDVIHLLRC
jgi:hypothetical protein